MQRESVAAVTGGARGIGRGIAAELAREGHDVLVLDLAAAAGEAAGTLAEVRALGRRAAFVPLDVTELAAIPAALDEGAAALGTPTVWVNNAGTIVRKPSLDVTPAEWAHVLDTCLTGAFFCAQAFARRLVAEQRPGVLVNISSIFGLTGGPRRAAYSSAKAGLVNLTRLLANEWHEHGIRVNAVAPTFVETPLTAALLAGGLDVVNKGFGEQVATIADVARAVAFLAGPDAAMVNGHTLPVDGGWLAW